MTKSWTVVITFCWAAVFWCSVPCSGICSPSPVYQISETQINELQNILSGLEQDNAKLQSLLTESEEGLTTASNESSILRGRLTEAQKQLAELRMQLESLRAECDSARKSLDEANRELALASKSFKESMQQHERIEGRLRTQRNIWTVIACVLGGIAATR